MDKSQKIKISLSLLFLVVSLYFTSMWVNYTNNLYSGLSVSKDIFFQILPFVDLSVFLDVFSLLGPLLFIAFILVKKTGNKIPYYAVVVGIFYLIRSFFIYAFPLANPFPLEKWGIGLFPTGGMFPSGHTGILFLIFLFMKEEPKSRSWAFVLLILTALEGILMVISRGHYSIDVLGAIVIVYGLHTISKKYLQKPLTFKL